MDRKALVPLPGLGISPQKTPAHWIAVDDWPLTGSGKIPEVSCCATGSSRVSEVA